MYDPFLKRNFSPWLHNGGQKLFVELQNSDSDSDSETDSDSDQNPLSDSDWVSMRRYAFYAMRSMRWFYAFYALYALVAYVP
jgi:hypothetical protein